MTRPAALVLGALLLASAWLSWRGWTSVTALLPSAVQARVGQRAPAIDLPGLDGRTVRLSALRGRPVLINFWATWCTACRQEMPRIERFYEANRGRVRVIGVDVGEPAATVAAFVRRYGYTWRFALDQDKHVSNLYGVHYIPTSFWLDSHGVVRAVYTGPMTEPLMRSFLREAE